METFGDVVIRIVMTIINGSVNMFISVASDVILLFRTIVINIGILSPLGIIIAIVIMSAILFGIFNLFKGQLKPVLIAAAILAIIMAFTIMLF